MAFGTDHVQVGEVGTFIPELWSDEVIVAYKTNLVFANLVRKLNHNGKKGDTIRIPTPARGSASVKAADTIVTFIAHTSDTSLSVLLDEHQEYSRLIEDLVTVQALESLRAFYTDDGGFAIATAVDTQLILEAALTGYATLVTVGGVIQANSIITAALLEGDGSAWDESATATDISDAGIRTFVKNLDDENAPMAGRVLVVPTIAKSDLLGTARFTEQAFTGEVAGSNTIRNGLVGNVYGMEVYVTTNLPTIEDSTDSNGTASKVLGLCFQRDALLLVEQMGVRAQSQYKQEYLSDLMTVDMIWGQLRLRNDSIVPFVVPTT